jgi:hypothetical protein
MNLIGHTEEGNTYIRLDDPSVGLVGVWGRGVQ